MTLAPKILRTFDNCAAGGKPGTRQVDYRRTADIAGGRHGRDSIPELLLSKNPYVRLYAAFVAQGIDPPPTAGSLSDYFFSLLSPQLLVAG